MEVLVAIAIFSLAVTGVIAAATQGGININSAKNRLTANYLAQEGIELMRAKRDSYVLANPTSFAEGWASFAVEAATNCSAAGPCDVDIADTTTPVTGTSTPLGLRFIPCTASCVLNYDGATTGKGFYSHGVGTPTAFTRRITVVGFPPVSPNELEVTSTVTWTEGLSQQSVVVSESIFNWY